MQTFTPFPLRARGLVEQFDAAIKLYKQYFWVLLGWSAIVTGAGVLGAVLPFGGMASFFLTPLAIGSASCCVAAAVRGQSVEFGQCWRFTQPRYWPVLGLHLLASLIAGAVMAVVIGIMVGVSVGGVALLGSSSGAAQVAMGIFAFLVFSVVGTIVGSVFFSFVGLVPIVVCMEDDKRGMPALNRAYEILRGHWLRVTTLMGLVGLAMLALLAILASTAALLVGVNNIKDMMNGGRGNETALILGIIGFGGSYTLLLMLWSPLYYLILTVFYLDVRVRQEALDLEWTAHATAPSELNSGASTPLAPRESFAPSLYENTNAASAAPTAFSGRATQSLPPQEYSPLADSPDPSNVAPSPFAPPNAYLPDDNFSPATAPESSHATQQLSEGNEAATPRDASPPATTDTFPQTDFIEAQPRVETQPDDNGVLAASDAAPVAPDNSPPDIPSSPRPQW